MKTYRIKCNVSGESETIEARSQDEAAEKFAEGYRTEDFIEGAEELKPAERGSVFGSFDVQEVFQEGERLPNCLDYVASYEITADGEGGVLDIISVAND